MIWVSQPPLVHGRSTALSSSKGAGAVTDAADALASRAAGEEDGRGAAAGRSSRSDAEKQRQRSQQGISSASDTCSSSSSSLLEDAHRLSFAALQILPEATEKVGGWS